MSVADGAAARVTYKAYSTGVITSNSQPVSATDPAAGSAQILRRVSSTLKLDRPPYTSAEVRNDRQLLDVRLGSKRVTGSITGELSPGSYKDFFEAASRGTWEAALSLSNTDLTSVISSSVTSTFTFAGGAPVTLGMRVGHILRFANLATSANNATNYVITGFSGTSNRVVAVYPAPTTDATPDSSFTVTSAGQRLVQPSSSLVERKFGVEHYYEDIDLAKLFTECRVGGFNIGLPAEGMATCDFTLMGRDMEVTTGASAPFFTSPTAETTTGIFAAVNGLLQVGGTTVGVVTGLSLAYNLNPSTASVVGQNYVPEIFLGRANLTGQMTAFLEDATLINDFKNETEISILAYLTTTSDVNSPAMTLYVPRVKFTGDDNPVQGESGQSITLPFQALKYNGTEASTGITGSTIQICDSEA